MGNGACSSCDVRLKVIKSRQRQEEKRIGLEEPQVSQANGPQWAITFQALPDYYPFRFCRASSIASRQPKSGTFCCVATLLCSSTPSHLYAMLQSEGPLSISLYFFCRDFSSGHETPKCKLARFVASNSHSCSTQKHKKHNDPPAPTLSDQDFQWSPFPICEFAEQSRRSPGITPALC
jgi:hypothetical protein